MSRSYFWKKEKNVLSLFQRNFSPSIYNLHSWPYYQTPSFLIKLSITHNIDLMKKKVEVIRTECQLPLNLWRKNMYIPLSWWKRLGNAPYLLCLFHHLDTILRCVFSWLTYLPLPSKFQPKYPFCPSHRLPDFNLSTLSAHPDSVLSNLSTTSHITGQSQLTCLSL